jgi:hypothetical protein
VFWVTAIGLEPSGYGTHSMRRTKAAEIYRKVGNLRAVQLLLGHTKVDRVIPPFLTGCIRRTYAAIFSFMAGVMPPMPMLGRSLL